MSIIKQELYIAKKTKNKELQVLLSTLVFASMKDEGCVAFEVYQSDDDVNEFLVYSEFKDNEAFTKHEKSEPKKALTKKFEELVLKKEILPILD